MESVECEIQDASVAWAQKWTVDIPTKPTIIKTALPTIAAICRCGAEFNLFPKERSFVYPSPPPSPQFKGIEETSLVLARL